MFKKNIQILKAINPSLADKILSISLDEISENISVLKTNTNEYVMQKNRNYIDDFPSPLESAKNIYQENVKSAKNRYDFIIVFGLGMGNLLDYVMENSLSKVILYEPDLEIIRFTMEYVDLTSYFLSGRCFISNNLTECLKFVQDKYLLEDKIEFVYLKNYVMLHPSEFKVLTDRIFEVCQAKIIDMNTIKLRSKVWIENIFSRFKAGERYYELSILNGKFLGKTAIILGAGPSLKDNIDKIKENRDKYVIFTVHRTLETLKNNGIVPDFCVIVDAAWVENSIINDENYLKNINLILDAKADSAINKYSFKNKFIYFSSNNIFSKKLLEIMPNEVKLLNSAGTSTLMAYLCAKNMGFKNLIFAGIDLAFKNDTAYCDGKIAITADKDKIVIEHAQIQTTDVKSVTGEYVKTRLDYASFIRQFETFFAKDKTSVLYNVTSFGAFINGMKYDSLENILSLIESKNTDVNMILKDTIEKNKNLAEKIYTSANKILKDEQNKIMPIVSAVDEWFEMYKMHPLFFEKASNVITKITSSMILQEYVQIELLKFTKLLYENNEEKKRLFLNEFFISIKNYSNILNNLII